MCSEFYGRDDPPAEASSGSSEVARREVAGRFLGGTLFDGNRYRLSRNRNDSEALL